MTRHSLLLAGSALVVLPFARPPAARAETLSELVSYALEHHPDVQAMASSVRAAEEAISPARTWPDPQLSVSIMNMGLTDWTVGTEPMAQGSINIAQEIPIGSKLGLRHEIAQAHVTQARASLATTKNRVARDVALAALDLYELDQTVRIESQIRERYREMVRVAEGRLAVGQTMQQDVLGMMLDVDMSTVAITEALDRRNALVAKLNGLLNRPVDAPFDSLTVAPLPSAPTDAASLIARALEDRPELSRLRATVAQAETMRRLAMSDRIPNPMVMARYANRGSMDGLYEVGMSMILPVRPDRRQNAAIREAAAVLDVRREETSAAELETRTSVSSLVAELATVLTGPPSRFCQISRCYGIDAIWPCLYIGRVTKPKNGAWKHYH